MRTKQARYEIASTPKPIGLMLINRGPIYAHLAIPINFHPHLTVSFSKSIWSAHSVALAFAGVGDMGVGNRHGNVLR